MERKRFSAEQIVAILKERGLRVPGTELCRRVRIRRTRSYRKLYGASIGDVRPASRELTRVARLHPRRYLRAAPT